MSRKQGRPTILIVDHNEVLRNNLKVLLDAAGYDVTTAHNGYEASYIAAANRPDLIITGIFFPQTDCFELIQYFRSTLPAARMIVTGEKPMARYLSMARQLGADAVLHTPCRPDTLLASVLPLVSRPRQGDA